MQRTVYQQLVDWKASERRKPLIIEGARQVGKTWIVKDFGNREYQSVAYINFEEMKPLRNMFEADLDVNRIMDVIRLATKNACLPGHTLIFLDEIQEAPHGLTALKYFQENMPEQHVIVAGSLLGIELHRRDSFPVGKVDFLRLYPMSYLEFLNAVGEGELASLLQRRDWSMITLFKSKYIDRLRQYYFVGGMPEAVAAFADGASFEEVRNIQLAILQSYDNDFSKHAPHELVPRIRAVWNSIPAQLSRENRKFVFGIVKEGARARDYESALMWLNDCGLIHQVHAVKTPRYPLKSYEDMSAFKLFSVDIGLLCAQSEIDSSVLVSKNDILTEFKGALTEQYVMQQLIINHTLYYWSKANSQAEIDFLVQKGTEIVPIEVKAEENLRAKSLRLFVEGNQSATAYRLSMSDYRQECWMTNVPLYGANGDLTSNNS